MDFDDVDLRLNFKKKETSINKKTIFFSQENLHRIVLEKKNLEFLLSDLEEKIYFNNKSALIELLHELKDDFQKTNTVSIKKLNIVCEGLKLKKLEVLNNESNESNEVVNCNQINIELLNNSKFGLKHVDLSIKAGEKVLVFGNNGSGKSTLLKFLSGNLQLKSKQGTAMIMNQNYFDDSSWIHIKRDILYMSNLSTVWKATLYEDLLFACGGDENKINQFNIYLELDKYKEFKWSQLSDGFKTRYLLAYSLIKAPKILIIDEPFGTLDSVSLRATLYQIQLHALETAIIFTSQSLQHLDNIVDKVLNIKGDRVISYSRNDLIVFKKDILELQFDIYVNLEEIFKNEIENKQFKILSNRENEYKYVVELFNIDKQYILRKLVFEGCRMKVFKDLSLSFERIMYEGILND